MDDKFFEKIKKEAEEARVLKYLRSRVFNSIVMFAVPKHIERFCEDLRLEDLQAKLKLSPSVEHVAAVRERAIKTAVRQAAGDAEEMNGLKTRFKLFQATDSEIYYSKTRLLAEGEIPPVRVVSAKERVLDWVRTKDKDFLNQDWPEIIDGWVQEFCPLERPLVLTADEYLEKEVF